MPVWAVRAGTGLIDGHPQMAVANAPAVQAVRAGTGLIDGHFFGQAGSSPELLRSAPARA